MMKCPCPCSHCDDWFDLHDGRRSEKWYPDTVICKKCAKEEKEEIEWDENVAELKEELDEARWTLDDSQKTIDRVTAELQKLGVKPEEIEKPA